MRVGLGGCFRGASRAFYNTFFFVFTQSFLAFSISPVSGTTLVSALVLRQWFTRYHPDSDGRMKSKQSRDTPTLVFYFGIAALYARAASSFRDGVEKQGICFLVYIYATVTGLEAEKEVLIILRFASAAAIRALLQSAVRRSTLHGMMVILMLMYFQVLIDI